MMLYNCIAPPKYIDIIRTLFYGGAFRILMKDNIKNQMKIFEMTQSEIKNPKLLDLFKNIILIKNTHYEVEPPNAYSEDRLNNFCYSVYDLIN